MGEKLASLLITLYAFRSVLAVTIDKGIGEMGFDWWFKVFFLEDKA